MGQKKLEVQEGLESALCVLAINAVWHQCGLELEEGSNGATITDLVEHLNLAGLNVTAEQIMEAFEEVATNNNEYDLMGVSDPYNEDMEEGQ